LSDIANQAKSKSNHRFRCMPAHSPVVTYFGNSCALVIRPTPGDVYVCLCSGIKFFWSKCWLKWCMLKSLWTLLWTAFLRSVRRLLVTANVVPSSPVLVTLIMKALRSSVSSVLTRATRRHIPSLRSDIPRSADISCASADRHWHSHRHYEDVYAAPKFAFPSLPPYHILLQTFFMSLKEICAAQHKMHVCTSFCGLQMHTRHLVTALPKMIELSLKRRRILPTPDTEISFAVLFVSKSIHVSGTFWSCDRQVHSLL
jgi:hypothetical protein